MSYTSGEFYILFSTLKKLFRWAASVGSPKVQLLAIDDKNGINACKLLDVAFATAVAILIRSWEKRLLGGPDALAKLELLDDYSRYKDSIVEDARRRLEAEP